MRSQPTLVVELNDPALVRAGWSPGELAVFLRSHAPYNFCLLPKNRPGAVVPVLLEQMELGSGEYVDVVAVSSASAPKK